MPDQFYIYKDGAQHGPYTFEDLQGFVATKKLLLRDKIRKSDSDEWMSAGRYESLFPPQRRGDKSLIPGEEPAESQAVAPANTWLVIALVAGNALVLAVLVLWLVLRLLHR